MMQHIFDEASANDAPTSDGEKQQWGGMRVPKQKLLA
jgi:hypothetical protein